MPKTVIEYSIFIASPSDVLNERHIAKQVIYDWNSSIGQTLGIRLSPVTWETNATPRMGDKPQAIINRELIGDCDILVGIFWTRIGSPTETAASGTIEEIEQFVKAKKPALIYFSSILIDPNKIDLEQYKRLREFELEARQNGLLGEFNDPDELRAKIHADLTRTIAQLEKSTSAPQDDPVEAFAEAEQSTTEEAKHETDIKQGPFESLSPKDRDFWQARAARQLMEGGASSIGPNAINSYAAGLYRESMKTTNDLRQEFLAGQRAAMRRDRISEDVKKAASRLPKEGLK